MLLKQYGFNILHDFKPILWDFSFYDNTGDSTRFIPDITLNLKFLEAL